MTPPTACIIGWPVKHSRSPVIHRFWLQAIRHRRRLRHPAGRAGRRSARSSRASSTAPFVGCNVTVPHKEAAFAAVDEIEPAGRAIGAVNTVWRDGRRLVATSTDGIGFLANLDEAAPGWDAAPGPAVVLGAGGAARAVIWALRERGFAPIHVVNRTAGRAEALAARFGRDVKPAGWDALPGLLRRRAHPRQHDLARHGRPAAARPRPGRAPAATAWSPTSSMCRWRPGSSPPRGRGGSAPSTVSACSSIRRCRASSAGSGGCRR